MKKFFFFIAFVATSMLSIAQNNQLVWLNGRLLYGTPIGSIDSLTYDQMQDVDTLHLLLPHTFTEIIHDTIVIHDTMYIDTDCVDLYNGHEYVDLGLPSGVRWATCNVGANTPEEYGYYFAWGEIEPKKEYTWDTYKWCVNYTDFILIKYNHDTSFGVVDNKKELDRTDDAATMNWGGFWRIPTYKDFAELVENCTQTWITRNGINGILFTANNGNSVFFPTAGRYVDKTIYDSGSHCWFWINNYYTGLDPIYAFTVDFFLNGGVGQALRCEGLSIRPICP